MTTATIRALTAADLPAVRAIVDATGLFPSAMLDDMVAAHLAGDAGERWVVACDPDPRGVAYCAPERLTSGTWNVLAIAVAPAAQGRGLGGQLMAHLEAALAREGQRLVLVDTSGTPAFERTRAFYRGLGYAVVATIPDYYDVGDAKVTFCKRLPARTP